MTSEKAQIDINARYESRDVARLLGVSLSTVEEWTESGYLKCSIRKANGRRIWLGSDILSIWKDTQVSQVKNVVPTDVRNGLASVPVGERELRWERRLP